MEAVLSEVFIDSISGCFLVYNMRGMQPVMMSEVAQLLRGRVLDLVLYTLLFVCCSVWEYMDGDVSGGRADTWRQSTACTPFSDSSADMGDRFD